MTSSQIKAVMPGLMDFVSSMKNFYHGFNSACAVDETFKTAEAMLLSGDMSNPEYDAQLQRMGENLKTLAHLAKAISALDIRVSDALSKAA